jgi:2-polyprenyl-3-methyl-5-hydroxy-6-metoxy-1,4-benzoquinol methylase
MDANAYRKERVNHWNEVAQALGKGRKLGESYFQRLVQIYRFNVPEGMRILELGCGQGDLLAALKPSRGVGIDFSNEMARRAWERHPELYFLQADVHDFEINEKFDFVILSDLVNDLWDVQTVLDNVRKVCEPNTRIIINTYSRLWELPLKFGEWIGQAKPVLNQNWLEVKDVNHFLILSGFEPMRTWAEYLEPFPIPLMQPFCNRYLVKLGIFGWMALTNFIIARPSLSRSSPFRCRKFQ